MQAHLQQVQPLHALHVHAGQVAEGLVDAHRLGVHHQRALAGHVAPVPHLALAPPQVPAGLGAVDVRLAAQPLQQLDRLGGLGEVLRAVLHHQRQLRHRVDAVPARHHQRRPRRRRQR